MRQESLNTDGHLSARIKSSSAGKWPKLNATNQQNFGLNNIQMFSKNMDQEKQQRYSMLSDACIKIFNLDGSLQKSKLALDLELIINDI